MWKKIGLGVLAVLIAFFGYVATKDGKFNYERSDVVNAPVEKIFPYISNLRMGAQWSPYEKMDLNMKKNFSGTDGQVGSKMEFDGNSDVGAGSVEILKVVPNELVELRLIMTRPMNVNHIITYKLIPEGTGTRFSWTMSGDGGYMGKLMTTLIDCEKMVGDQMLSGIANLKSLVEVN